MVTVVTNCPTSVCFSRERPRSAAPTCWMLYCSFADGFARHGLRARVAVNGFGKLTKPDMMTLVWLLWDAKPTNGGPTAAHVLVGPGHSDTPRSVPSIRTTSIHGPAFVGRVAG